MTSRNEFIVDVLKEYFTSGEASLRQGVIFCVNVSHANEMARLLNKAGIVAASYTGQTKNPASVLPAAPPPIFMSGPAWPPACCVCSYILAKSF